MTNREIRLCIVAPNEPSYSETFIQAHIDRLTAQTHVLFGTDIDGLRQQDGQSLTPPFTLWRHLLQTVDRKLYRRSWEEIVSQPFQDYLTRHKVDAVLAEYGPTGVAVMKACQRVGVPLVVQFFGFDAYEHTTLSGIGRFYPALFELASAVVAVSRHMEQQLLSLGVPRHKLHYNFCGADIVRFAGAEPASAPPRFVAIGRFANKKAPLLTLLAFRQLISVVPEATMVMVGDGPLFEASCQLVDRLGISHAVTLPGARPHQELAPFMLKARAFVQHSVRTKSGDSEGTPVIVLEASAAGLPIISTRHGGIPDVVLDGETGLLVDEGDVDGMAAAMIRLARDPVLAGQLGRAARARVTTEFSTERSVGVLEGIIRDAVIGNRANLDVVATRRT